MPYARTHHSPANHVPTILSPTSRSRTRPAKLALVLDELLALADAHESAELARYRRLAFSFLTYCTATSRLMAAMGIECEMRLEKLRRVSQQLGLQSPSAKGTSRRAGLNSASAQYFCISNQGMAIDELIQAIADAEYSLRFYEHLSEISAAPELYPILSAIIRQKQAEHAVLQERLASCDDLGHGMGQKISSI
jgi:hypothetical protein